MSDRPPPMNRYYLASLRTARYLRWAECGAVMSHLLYAGLVKRFARPMRRQFGKWKPESNYRPWKAAMWRERNRTKAGKE